MAVLATQPLNRFYRAVAAEASQSRDGYPSDRLAEVNPGAARVTFQSKPVPKAEPVADGVPERVPPLRMGRLRRLGAAFP